MDEVVQSSHRRTLPPGRGCKKCLTGCRHLAQSLTSAVAKLTTDLGDGMCACQVARNHEEHNGCRSVYVCVWESVRAWVYVCVCVIFCEWILVSPIFLLWYFLPFCLWLTAVCALSHPLTWPAGLGLGLDGWGEWVWCGGQRVGSGCFLLYSGWLHTN